MSRVFVTGLGVASPLGNSVSEFQANLLAGRSGLRKLQRTDVSDLPAQIGGEVDGLDEPPVKLNERVAWRKMDRASRFAVAAAAQAIEDAGIQPAATDIRCQVVIGAGLSGLDTLQQQTELLLTRGPRRVSPLTIPLLMPNAAPANVSLVFGIRGPALTVSAACASSGLAMIEAAEALRRGAADVVVTGGTESSLTRLGIAAFCNMGAMAKCYNNAPEKAVRPFSADRDGLVMSEGAGIVVLETEESLRRRGGRAYAELIGWGSTSDAWHLVAPDPSCKGTTAAIEQAIHSAGLAPEDIADRVWVNAHGTGTPVNDALETKALKRVFGDAAHRLRISSTKSMTGHLIGAAGAVESVACVRALLEGHVPPTINLDIPDPECDLDYVPHESRKVNIDYAINNTFGFGGHNVSLLIGRVD